MENQSVLTSDSALPHENVNLRHYWHVILERRWLVIAALALPVLVKAKFWRGDHVQDGPAQIRANSCHRFALIHIPLAKASRLTLGGGQKSRSLLKVEIC